MLKKTTTQPFYSDALGQIFMALIRISDASKYDALLLSLTPAIINYSKLLSLCGLSPIISSFLCNSAEYLPKN